MTNIQQVTLHEILENEATEPPSHVLYSEITLTDFTNPQHDPYGCLLFSFPSSAEICSMIRHPYASQEILDVLGELSSISRFSSQQYLIESIGDTIASIFFLSACLSDNPDPSVVSYIQYRYAPNGSEKYSIMKRLFSACMKSAIFPHELLSVVGTLCSYVDGNNISKITTVLHGSIAAASIESSSRYETPQVTRLTVPSSNFIDFDKMYNITNIGKSNLFIFLLYHTSQNLNETSIYTVKSCYNFTHLRDLLLSYFEAVRLENIVSNQDFRHFHSLSLALGAAVCIGSCLITANKSTVNIQQSSLGGVKVEVAEISNVNLKTGRWHLVM